MLQRICQIVGWLLFAAIVIVTVSPIGLRPHLGYGADLDRFVAFLVSGLFLGFGYKRRWLLVLCLLAVSAFGIEALQILTPDRHARLWDAMIKAGGGILGVLAAQMVIILKAS